LGVFEGNQMEIWLFGSRGFHLAGNT